jgi:hypothetical protein
MLAARTMLPLRSSRTIPFYDNEIVNERYETMATASDLLAELQEHLSESWQSFQKTRYLAPRFVGMVSVPHRGI